jgi:hypothetical protein
MKVTMAHDHSLIVRQGQQQFFFFLSKRICLKSTNNLTSSFSAKMVLYDRYIFAQVVLLFISLLAIMFIPYND